MGLSTKSKFLAVIDKLMETCKVDSNDIKMKIEGNLSEDLSNNEYKILSGDESSCDDEKMKRCMLRSSLRGGCILIHLIG